MCDCTAVLQQRKQPSLSLVDGIRGPAAALIRWVLACTCGLDDIIAHLEHTACRCIPLPTLGTLLSFCPQGRGGRGYCLAQHRGGAQLSPLALDTGRGTTCATAFDVALCCLSGPNPRSLRPPRARVHLRFTFHSRLLGAAPLELLGRWRNAGLRSRAR